MSIFGVGELGRICVYGVLLQIKKTMAQYGLETESTEHLAGMTVCDATNGGGSGDDNELPWDSLRITGFSNFIVMQITNEGTLHLFFNDYHGTYPEEPYYGKFSVVGIEPYNSLVQTLPAQYMYIHFHDDAPPTSERWVGNMRMFSYTVIITKHPED